MFQGSWIRNAAGALVASAALTGAAVLIATPARDGPAGVAGDAATSGATFIALPCPPHTPIIKG